MKNIYFLITFLLLIHVAQLQVTWPINILHDSADATPIAFTVSSSKPQFNTKFTMNATFYVKRHILWGGNACGVTYKDGQIIPQHPVWTCSPLANYNAGQQVFISGSFNWGNQPKSALWNVTFTSFPTPQQVLTFNFALPGNNLSYQSFQTS